MFEMFKKIFLSMLMLLVFFPAAPSAKAAGRGVITVAAASSFSDALLEIKKGFEEGGGAKVRIVFGSSGLLARQIERGAPFDVFISANSGYMDDLARRGAVRKGSVRAFARGVLVIVYHKKRGAAEIKRLVDLLDPGTGRVAIANPEHAPYGRAAVEALKKAGVFEAVRKKLVYGENVRQALQFVESGNAGAGFVALSIAKRRRLGVTVVDESLHGPIVQTVAVVGGTRSAEEAERFVEYLTGPAGRSVLERYGFRVESR